MFTSLKENVVSPFSNFTFDVPNQHEPSFPSSSSLYPTLGVVIQPFSIIISLLNLPKGHHQIFTI